MNDGITPDETYLVKELVLHLKSRDHVFKMLLFFIRVCLASYSNFFDVSIEIATSVC